jgi:hypothetical protein
MNFIESYPNALSIEKCQQICDRMDDIISRPDPGSSCVLSNDATRTDWNIFTGRYGSLKLLEDSVVDAVHAGWRKYNKQYGAASRAFLELFTPGWKFQKSETGGGFHTWHTEQGSGKNNRGRFGVWMLYLNTVEEGGKTEFKFQDLAVKPEAGTLLIWPAAYSHVHRAAPDLVGNKYIATGWFEYPEKVDVR